MPAPSGAAGGRPPAECPPWTSASWWPGPRRPRRMTGSCLNGLSGVASSTWSGCTSTPGEWRRFPRRLEARCCCQRSWRRWIVSSRSWSSPPLPVSYLTGCCRTSRRCPRRAAEVSLRGRSGTRATSGTWPSDPPAQAIHVRSVVPVEMAESTRAVAQEHDRGPPSPPLAVAPSKRGEVRDRLDAGPRHGTRTHEATDSHNAVPALHADSGTTDGNDDTHAQESGAERPGNQLGSEPVHPEADAEGHGCHAQGGVSELGERQRGQLHIGSTPTTRRSIRLAVASLGLRPVSTAPAAAAPVMLAP